MPSQSDIARDIQKGIEKANEHAKERRKDAEVTENQRATRFDGNPNPQGDSEGGVFGPKDDTPAVLPKRLGPKGAETKNGH